MSQSPAPSSPRIVGIDLGTTHCAVAWVDASLGAKAPVNDFAVPQLWRPHEVRAAELLPSCVYLRGEHDLPADTAALPWTTPSTAGASEPVVGELARWQGAKVPGRLVASAKSWLCHPGVDRQAAILPWTAPPEVERISPVEAQRRLLAHIRSAWNAAFPAFLLENQEVVVTVPASFDEAARALTVTAIRQAGLARFTLLEEPQAAFYAFTAEHRAEALAPALGDAKLVLVVDVGGGTSDFTLVQTAVLPEGPVLRRIAVGEHLLLGGDNMDVALARLAEGKLSEGGKRVPASSWAELTLAARAAKESLLSENAPASQTVSLQLGGSKLFGNTVSATLEREEVERVLGQGFFPDVEASAAPQRPSRMALAELGLPYAQDAGLTRHLVAFLRMHAAAGDAALRGELPKTPLAGTGYQPTTDAPVNEKSRAAGTSDASSPTSASDGSPAGASATGSNAPTMTAPQARLPRPDALLLNGGVFHSPGLTKRLVSSLSALFPSSPPIPVLAHASLDTAVARGAAYFGLTRRGFGLRIGGGAARAYYVGIASPENAEQLQSVCLIPRGFDEGAEVDLERTFHLTLGAPVQFQLHSTTADRIDRPGDVVTFAADDETFRALPPIHTVLAGKDGKKGARIPVQLRASLTEIGTLELACVSETTDERWRLEFELRGTQTNRALSITESMPARFQDATGAVVRVYGNKPLPVEPKDIKGLFRTLEKSLGPKESWRVPVLRELWSALFAGAARRRRTADHERIFYQTLGFALRPGFGYPLDAWRAQESFGLFSQELTFHTDKSVWLEYWVMWRRIAGGLDEAAQRKIFDSLRPHLERRVPPDAKPGPKLKGIVPEGLDEMVRTAASLEHVNAAQKEELGDWVLARLMHPQTQGGPWTWALGRLGARQPLYGSSHRVVAAETVERWLTTLLAIPQKQAPDGLPFTLVQLARMTGDRVRDIEPGIRAQVLERLAGFKVPATWTKMVAEVAVLEAADEARALGDTLPQGLSLQ